VQATALTVAELAGAKTRERDKKHPAASLAPVIDSARTNHDGVTPRILRSRAEVEAAAAAGEVTIV